jgi:predicted phosphate transport protein (TIGR00153 family)
MFRSLIVLAAGISRAGASGRRVKPYYLSKSAGARSRVRSRAAAARAVGLRRDPLDEVPMLGWFRALMPKEDRFFDLFERHAQTLVDGAAALQRLMRGGAVQEDCQAISEHEEKADDITREALLAVRRSFITPFDRSDIQALVSSLDDTIDQMKKTAKAVQLFEVDRFEPPMQEMAGIIIEAAGITREAIPLMRSIGENATRLNGLTEKVIQLEGRADDIHNKGLKALFTAARAADPMAFIVGSEIYDHLEKVMDRFEDVANRISSILVEHL